MSALTSAARVAELLAWQMYESDLDERDAFDKMVLDKIDEISKSAEEMQSAVYWFMNQSNENVDLVDAAYHALDLAVPTGNKEKIDEAAIGIYEIRDRACREYATHLVSREVNN